jgi:hypothetical protein
MFNKELYVVSFGRVCRMYSYLGECVQLMHPLVVVYCLWLFKLTIVE